MPEEPIDKSASDAWGYIIRHEMPYGHVIQSYFLQTPQGLKEVTREQYEQALVQQQIKEITLSPRP